MAGKDCLDWTSTSFTQTGAIANAGMPGQFFWGAGLGNCNNAISIYCVQQ